MCNGMPFRSYKLNINFFKEKNQLGPKRLIKSELGSVKLLLVMI